MAQTRRDKRVIDDIKVLYMSTQRGTSTNGEPEHREYDLKVFEQVMSPVVELKKLSQHVLDDWIIGRRTKRDSKLKRTTKNKGNSASSSKLQRSKYSVNSSKRSIGLSDEGNENVIDELTYLKEFHGSCSDDVTKTRKTTGNIKSKKSVSSKQKSRKIVHKPKSKVVDGKKVNKVSGHIKSKSTKRINKDKKVKHVDNINETEVCNHAGCAQEVLDAKSRNQLATINSVIGRTEDDEITSASIVKNKKGAKSEKPFEKLIEAVARGFDEELNTGADEESNICRDDEKMEKPPPVNIAAETLDKINKTGVKQMTETSINEEQKTLLDSKAKAIVVKTARKQAVPKGSKRNVNKPAKGSVASKDTKTDTHIDFAIKAEMIRTDTNVDENTKLKSESTDEGNCYDALTKDYSNEESKIDPIEAEKANLRMKKISAVIEAVARGLDEGSSTNADEELNICGEGSLSNGANADKKPETDVDIATKTTSANCTAIEVEATTNDKAVEVKTEPNATTLAHTNKDNDDTTCVESRTFVKSNGEHFVMNPVSSNPTDIPECTTKEISDDNTEANQFLDCDIEQIHITNELDARTSTPSVDEYCIEDDCDNDKTETEGTTIFRETDEATYTAAINSPVPVSDTCNVNDPLISHSMDTIDKVVADEVLPIENNSLQAENKSICDLGVDTDRVNLLALSNNKSEVAKHSDDTESKTSFPECDKPLETSVPEIDSKASHSLSILHELEPSGMTSTLLQTESKELCRRKSNKYTKSTKRLQCKPKSSSPKGNAFSTLYKFLKGHKHLQSKFVSTFNKQASPSKSPSKSQKTSPTKTLNKSPDKSRNRSPCQSPHPIKHGSAADVKVPAVSPCNSEAENTVDMPIPASLSPKATTPFDSIPRSDVISSSNNSQGVSMSDASEAPQTAVNSITVSCANPISSIIVTENISDEKSSTPVVNDPEMESLTIAYDSRDYPSKTDGEYGIGEHLGRSDDVYNSSDCADSHVVPEKSESPKHQDSSIPSGMTATENEISKKAMDIQVTSDTKSSQSRDACSVEQEVHEEEHDSQSTFSHSLKQPNLFSQQVDKDRKPALEVAMEMIQSDPVAKVDKIVSPKCTISKSLSTDAASNKISKALRTARQKIGSELLFSGKNTITDVESDHSIADVTKTQTDESVENLDPTSSLLQENSVATLACSSLTDEVIVADTKIVIHDLLDQMESTDFSAEMKSTHSDPDAPRVISCEDRISMFDSGIQIIVNNASSSQCEEVAGKNYNHPDDSVAVDFVSDQVKSTEIVCRKHACEPGEHGDEARSNHADNNSTQIEHMEKLSRSDLDAECDSAQQLSHCSSDSIQTSNTNSDNEQARIKSIHTPEVKTEAVDDLPSHRESKIQDESYLATSEDQAAVKSVLDKICSVVCEAHEMYLKRQLHEEPLLNDNLPRKSSKRTSNGKMERGTSLGLESHDDLKIPIENKPEVTVCAANDTPPAISDTSKTPQSKVRRSRSKRRKFKLTMPPKRRIPPKCTADPSIKRPRVLLKIKLPGDSEPHLVEPSTGSDATTCTYFNDNITTKAQASTKTKDSKIKPYPRRNSIFYASDHTPTTEPELPNRVKKREKRQKTDNILDDAAGNTSTNDANQMNSDGRLSIEFAKHNWFLEKYKTTLQPVPSGTEHGLLQDSKDSQVPKKRKYQKRKKANPEEVQDIPKKKKHKSSKSDPERPYTHVNNAANVTKSDHQTNEDELRLFAPLIIAPIPEDIPVDCNEKQAPVDVIGNIVQTDDSVPNMQHNSDKSLTDLDCSREDAELKILEVVSLAGFVKPSSECGSDRLSIDDDDCNADQVAVTPDLPLNMKYTLPDVVPPSIPLKAVNADGPQDLSKHSIAKEQAPLDLSMKSVHCVALDLSLKPKKETTGYAQEQSVIVKPGIPKTVYSCFNITRLPTKDSMCNMSGDNSHRTTHQGQLSREGTPLSAYTDSRPSSVHSQSQQLSMFNQARQAAMYNQTRPASNQSLSGPASNQSQSRSSSSHSQSRPPSAYSSSATPPLYSDKLVERANLVQEPAMNTPFTDRVVRTDEVPNLYNRLSTAYSPTVTQERTPLYSTPVVLPLSITSQPTPVRSSTNEDYIRSTNLTLVTLSSTVNVTPVMTPSGTFTVVPNASRFTNTIKSSAFTTVEKLDGKLPITHTSAATVQSPMSSSLKPTSVVQSGFIQSPGLNQSQTNHATGLIHAQNQARHQAAAPSPMPTYQSKPGAYGMELSNLTVGSLKSMNQVTKNPFPQNPLARENCDDRMVQQSANRHSVQAHQSMYVDSKQIQKPFDVSFGSAKINHELKNMPSCPSSSSLPYPRHLPGQIPRQPLGSAHLPQANLSGTSRQATGGPNNVLVRQATDSSGRQDALKSKKSSQTTHKGVHHSSVDGSSLAVTIQTPQGPMKMPLSHMNCDACTEKANFLCSGCKRVAYCSPKCQFIAWQKHKGKCSK